MTRISLSMYSLKGLMSNPILVSRKECTYGGEGQTIGVISSPPFREPTSLTILDVRLSRSSVPMTSLRCFFISLSLELLSAVLLIKRQPLVRCLMGHTELPVKPALTSARRCPVGPTPGRSWPPTRSGRSGQSRCAVGSAAPTPARSLGSLPPSLPARSSHATPAAPTCSGRDREGTGSHRTWLGYILRQERRSTHRSQESHLLHRCDSAAKS